MKKIIILLLLISTTIFSQMDRLKRGGRDFGKRFDELEKIKLLEMLNLDEDAAIKFFSRRNQSRNKINSILAERDSLVGSMEKSIDKSEKINYQNLIEKLLSSEERIYLEKKRFINSLNDILSKEQIVKVMLFEQKFKRDVRDLLIERGRKKFFEDRKKRIDKN